MNEYSRSMRKNGYSESILPTNHGECYLCGKETDTAVHEVFYGTANRRNSKKYGTWVNLCPRCHVALHADPDGLDAELKRHTQWVFERTHTRQEFIEIFGRNYL